MQVAETGTAASVAEGGVAGAVAPEVGKLPVGKLENGEAAAVREPTKPAPRAKYQLEPVEANQKDIYTNIKQAVLDPFFHFF